MKYILGLFITLAGGWYILTNHSATQTKYKCEGAFSSHLGGEDKEDLSLSFIHEKYHPWVHLWSESDGNFWIESEIWTDYVPKLREDEKTIQAWKGEDFMGSF